MLSWVREPAVEPAGGGPVAAADDGPCNCHPLINQEDPVKRSNQNTALSGSAPASRRAIRQLSPAELETASGGSEVSQPIMLARSEVSQPILHPHSEISQPIL